MTDERSNIVELRPHQPRPVVWRAEVVRAVRCPGPFCVFNGDGVEFIPAFEGYKGLCYECLRVTAERLLPTGKPSR